MAVDARRPPDPSEPWQVQGSGATALLMLDGAFAPCTLSCAFCPRSLETRRREPPRQAAPLARVVDRFAQLIATLEADELVVVSDDILRFPALEALLERASAAGRRVVLGTPGLALVDPTLAALLARHGASVALTWWAHEPLIATRIAGRSDARDALERAWAVLTEHGVPVRMQVVVTRDNVASLDLALADLASRGQTDVPVHVFFPDHRRPPEAYLDQFPDLEALQAALHRLDAHPGATPTLHLGNLPLCQVDLRGLRRLDVRLARHGPHHNAFGTDGVAACTPCSERDRCVRIHPGYAARHPVRAFDREVVDEALRRTGPVERPALGPPADQGLPPEQGVPPEQGIPPARGLLPGQGVPPGQGTLPGQGVPRGEGLLPGAARPPAPGDVTPPPPASPPGRPAGGVAPGEGRPPGSGVLPRRRPPYVTGGRVPLRPLPSPPPQATGVSWSPDGRWLAVCHARGIDLHDHAPPPPGWWRRLTGRPVPVRRLSLRAEGPLAWLDGATFLVPRGPRADLQVVGVDGRTRARIVTPHARAHTVAVLPDGRLLVGGAGLTVHHPDGRFGGRWLPPDQGVQRVTVDREGRALAVVRDQPPVLLRDGVVLATPPWGRCVDAAVSSQGAWFATLEPDLVTLWDARTGRVRWRRPSGPHLRHVALAHDERHLVCTGGGGLPTAGSTLRLWNLDAGMRRADLLGHPLAVVDLALAADGRHAATVDARGDVLLWDLTTEVSGPADGTRSGGRRGRLGGT